MRKIFILFLSGLLGVAVAQEKKCATTEAMQHLFSKNNNRKNSFDKQQQQLSEEEQKFFSSHSLAERKQALQSVPNYTIPVVFHILHTGGWENISKAQVMDAMRILNEDFLKQNADTTQIVPPFNTIAANTQIEFRLATLDPNGQCTDGIIRHYDANTIWDGDYTKYIYTWDPTQYMNIYVVQQMTGFVAGAAGYTYLPGSLWPGDPMDAIVILHNYLGSIGTGTPGRSRVLSHEVGHWLNLDHVWGNTNSPGVACGDDGVSDTPITMGWTICNLTNNQICNPGIPENVQNYMEYSYCDNMFTIGQGLRMQNTIQNNVGGVGRDNICTPANLLATGVSSPVACIPSAEFVANKYSVCAGDSILFADFSSNGNPASVQWNFQGGSPAASNAFNPWVKYNIPGLYDVKYKVTNTAGSDSIIKTAHITVFSSTPSYINGFSDSFESSSIPNSDWKVKDPDNDGSWSRTNLAAYTGNFSALLTTSSSSGGGKDELIGPELNVSGMTNPKISFRVAYRQKSSSDNDLLRVWVSNNCGNSWILRYQKSGSQLATASPGSGSYIPSNLDWRMETVNINSSVAYPSVLFKFEAIGDSFSLNNNIYIEDINVFSSVSIDEINPSVISVFPNPVTEKSFTIEGIPTHSCEFEIINSLGTTINFEKTITHNAEVKIELPREISGGFYLLKIKTDQQELTKKLIISN